MYRNEAALLKSRGVRVIQYEKHNDEISGTLNRLTTVSDTVWSRRTYQDITSLIKKEKPDIAHFHNIWYLISPSAYYACKDSGVPVVQTLHNYRMFCANGLLLRDGKVCNDCVGKVPWRGAAFGCFRNSRLYSVPVVASEIIHRARKTWAKAVDAYIALTEFARRKFIECGLPAEKIIVKPNFLSEPPDFITSSRDYAVFLGRLSQEKGVDVLIDAVHSLRSSYPHNFPSFSFKIVGDGPLLEQAKGKRQEAKGVRSETGIMELLGRKSHAESMEIVRNAAFLVLPSVCYENFPMTIIEAFVCGKPVIASNLGAMASIVKDGKTGLLFEAGNAADLSAKIKWMLENEDACAEMGKNARAEFEAKYTADRNYEMLMGIYNQILAKGEGQTEGQEANG